MPRVGGGNACESMKAEANRSDEACVGEAGRNPAAACASAEANAMSRMRTKAEAKGGLRRVIRYHRGGKPLNTRRILQDLKQL